MTPEVRSRLLGSDTLEGALAAKAERLAGDIGNAWRDELLTADALSVASILRHFAGELRRGRLTGGRVIGERFAERALAAARAAVDDA